MVRFSSSQMVPSEWADGIAKVQRDFEDVMSASHHYATMSVLGGKIEP